MQCHELIEQMDDWCDERLGAAEARDCARHLEHCADCRLRLQAEQRRREAMATLPVPEPDATFEQRMLAGASGGRSRRWSSPMGRWSSPMMGTAMAACLAVGLMIGQWMSSGDLSPQSAGPDNAVVQEEADEPVQEEVATAWGLDEPVAPVASETVETVRLAFSAGEPMKNVTLTLEMPAHMELASFPGERTISWQVDLEKGQNLLSLPVRNLFPGQGELVAHLDDGERRKTFRTPVGNEPADNRGES